MSKKRTRMMVFQATALVFLMFFAGTLAHASEQMKKEKKPGMTEVKHKVGDAMQAIKEYSIDKKDQALAKAKEALNKMDSKIDELEKRSHEKWQQMSEASREKTEEELRELRKKRNEIAEWYGGMKQSSAKSWDAVKKGFIDSYHSLEQSFDKAAKKI
jgi:Na+/phosphate symporter